jgi:hypothetical protein
MRGPSAVGMLPAMSNLTPEVPTAEALPYGRDGFGRPAARPLPKSEQRVIAAFGVAILSLPPILGAILATVA